MVYSPGGLLCNLLCVVFYFKRRTSLNAHCKIVFEIFIFCLMLCISVYLPSSVFLTIRTAMSCGVRRDGVRARVGCLKKCLCLKRPVRKQRGPEVARIAAPKRAQLQHHHPHRENHLLQLVCSVSCHNHQNFIRITWSYGS